MSVNIFAASEVTVEKIDLIIPIPVRGRKWQIVRGLPINDFSRSKIDASVAEFKEEKSLVSELIS